MVDVCSADQQPSVEEEQKCICQAAAKPAETGLPGEALQCCSTSRATADSACQPHILIQPAQNIFSQEHYQVPSCCKSEYHYDILSMHIGCTFKARQVYTTMPLGTFMINGQAAHIMFCVPLLEVACVHLPAMCILYS